MQRVYSLKVLLKTAGLGVVWQAAVAADLVFEDNWKTVADGWSEERRYHVMTAAEARKLFKAITDPTHGVLRWIKDHW